MEILIVSRTKMKNGVCCGGLNLMTGEFIRIHDCWGRNLTQQAPFQIGEVYNMKYRPPIHLRPIPHVEDKEVMPNYEFIRRLGNADMINEIDRLVDVPFGGIESIYEGKLKHSSYSSYVSQESIPNHSVCFWRPDKPIVKSSFLNKTKYWYGGFNFSYVGFQTPLNVIPEGTLLRMSLSNWWSPDEIMPKRCYLQLSGWFIV